MLILQYFLGLQNFSTGRGGAGNIRSPSRDAKTPDTPDRRDLALAEEERIIKAHLAADLSSPVRSPISSSYTWRLSIPFD
jgi:hypothetical protein